MHLKPAWRITKSLPSDADCNVHRVRLMWRQWRQQKRRVWTVAEPQGGSDQHIHTVQNPASPTGDISLPDTNAKIHGLSFGHTYVKRSLTHAAPNTSVQTWMSARVDRRPTTNTTGFLFGGSWDGPLWGSSSSFESLEPKWNRSEPLPRPETMNNRVLWDWDHRR